MTVSTFLGVQTALRGLQAQQRALNVTAHNVANASTEGYSRQAPTLAASSALPLSAGVHGTMLGTGVDVQSYRRVRDQLLDTQYRGQNTSLGEHSARSDALAQVELSAGEPGDHGIANALSEFWSAWSTLSNASQSAPAREALIGKARALADSVNALQSSFTAARARASSEYDALACAGGQIDRTAGDLVATMNAIHTAELSGATPNELYDRRDVLLDQLSTMGRVTVTQSTAGGPQVSLGGLTIIAADDSTASARVPAGTFPMRFTTPPGGRLGALIDLASATGPIAGFQDDLDATMQSLKDSVNDIYGVTGADFFTYGSGRSGRPELHLNEPTISGATLRAGAGDAGDNSLALAIARLRGGTADTRYTQLVTTMGNAVTRAEHQKATARVLTDHLHDRRDSVSGVALDEEMANLVRFKRAYQASARALTTIDEMLDTLINRTGMVGR